MLDDTAFTMKETTQGMTESMTEKTPEELHPNLVEQIRLEEETWDISMAKYDAYLSRMLETGSIGDSKEVILIIKATIDTLSKYIDKFISMSNLRGQHRKCQQYLIQSLKTADNIAFVLIKTSIASLLGAGEVSALQLSKALVGALKDMHNLQSFKRACPKLFSYIEKHNRKKPVGRQRRAKRRAAKYFLTEDDVVNDFGKLLGTVCIDLLHKSGCNLIDVYPGKAGAVCISLSSDAKALFLRSKMFFGSMNTTYYPLVYPPKPWEGIKGSGGYYTQKDINLIKTRGNKDLYSILDRKPDLSRLVTVINKIQETPYCINKRVLSVVESIVKYNLVNPSSTPSNPILFGDIPYMETMNIHELVPKKDYGQIGSDGKFIRKEDKHRWLAALEAQESKIKRIESKRLAYKMALDVARRFSKYEKIYFSYTLDFRGRLYPLQTFLNPQMSDNIKPLLQFAKGQVLTESGLKWLKIHGANCYGYDKLVYDERISKIEEMEEDIKAIHADPIGNIRLWYEADAPLMYLAFCLSYGDYLENPQNPVYIPVQLDATCSGIQIYSGLLKDREGARAVNVIGKGRVNDIYQDVADIVERYLATGDFPQVIEYTPKDGIKTSQSTAVEATSLRGKVTRTLTKRNVMTQPYSVTRRGMYEQVYDLLGDYEDSNKVFWQGDKWIVSALLARLNERAIGEVVKGATRGQQFIKAVLREALKRTDEAFWYTPMFNFPALQRIKREKQQRLHTPLGYLVLYHQTEETHQQRMLNGIAPNYVHSLDQTLLFRTVERCLERGVGSFWLIHDSYGVLPNDVDVLNEEVREAYIELFEGDPLADWVSQILPSGVDVVQKAMVGDLDLSEVRESEYIFS